MRKSRQYSDSLRIGILLTLVGGFLDAYTYLCRGKVFANAQTGNMVMVAVRFMEGNFKEVIKYSMPIIAFAIGVLIVNFIKYNVENEKVHWRQAVLVVEMIFIIAVVFIPQGKYDHIANVIVSLVCALQLETFRKFQGNVYATTMCTGNLRSATEKLFLFFKTKDKKQLKIAMKYYFIIFIFILGAFIGGYISLKIGATAVIFSIIPLILSLMIMGRKEYKEIKVLKIVS